MIPASRFVRFSAAVVVAAAIVAVFLAAVPAASPVDTASADHWNISTVEADGEGTWQTDAEGAAANSATFNGNGSELHVLTNLNYIQVYSLEHPYNVSTMTFEAEYDLGADASSGNDIEWGDDGNKLYIAEQDSTVGVREFDAGTPYDPSTLTYNQLLDTSTEGTPGSVIVSDDGTKLIMSEVDGVVVYSYTLSTPYDVSTASLDGNFDTSSQCPASFGGYTTTNETGSTLYYGCRDDESSNWPVIQYDLSTSYDVTTASYTGEQQDFHTAFDGTSDGGIFWEPNGGYFHVVDGDIQTTDVKIYSQPDAEPLLTSSTTSESTTSSSSSDTFTKTFELHSSSDLFPPRESTFRVYEWQEDGIVGQGVIVPQGEFVQIHSEEFNFQDQSHVELRDLGLYRLEVVGPHGDVRRWTGYTADKDEKDDIYELVIWGPGGELPPPPGGYDPGDYGPGGIGDIDGDGVIEEPPDLTAPDFEAPNGTFPGDSDIQPHLQTGVFIFPGEGRCVGIRYWDPTRNTTEITYDFDVEGTEYSDTIQLDEPVGYYEECLAEQNVGPTDEELEGNLSEGHFDFSGIRNGTEFDFTYEFGSDFEIANGTGAAGLPVGNAGGGIGPYTLLGLLFLLGSISGLYSARRWLPARETPEVPVVGVGWPASPTMVIGWPLIFVIWFTDSVPDSGAALGLIGLVIFIYYEVLDGDLRRLGGVVPERLRM